MTKTGRKSSIKVFYRVYPMEENEWDNVKISEDRADISVKHLQEFSRKHLPNKNKKPIYWNFTTDGVFYNNTQEEIYSSIMPDILESVLDGQDAIIVGFGQTGSGKSLTMAGLQYPYQDRGLVPRIIERLHQLVDEKMSDTLKVCVQMSYIEVVSNNKAYDLLQPYPCCVDMNKINCINKVKLTNRVESLKLVYMAEGRKEFSHNDAYPSHAGTSILSFCVTTRNNDFTDPYKMVSKLHIIDLAGADNYGNVTSYFKHPSEVGNGNRCKSYLEQVILILMDRDYALKKLKHRTNIMLKYLGNSFSQYSLVRFIGHIRTSKTNLLITLSMLRFGQLVKGMKSKGVLIEFMENDEIRTLLLENEIKELKKEKLFNEMLRSSATTSYSIERRDQMERAVDQFLRNQIDYVQIANICDFRVALELMKSRLVMYEIEKSTPSKEAFSETTTRQSTRAKDSASKSLKSSSKKSIKSKESTTTPDLGVHGSRSVREEKPEIKQLEIKSSKKSLKSSTSVSLPQKAGKNADKGSKSSFAAFFQLLPDTLPEQKQAWLEYISSDRSSHKVHKEAFIRNEQDIKAAYKLYMAEIAKLTTLNELVQMRKNELLQATMSRKLLSLEFGGNVDNIKSDLEENCEALIQAAETDLNNQKEVVLKYQAELQLHLNYRHEIKLAIKEDFDSFCQEKYHTQVGSLEDIIKEMDEDEVKINLEPEEEMKAEEVISEEEKAEMELYDQLRVLMVREAKKKGDYKKKTVHWIDY